MNIRGESGLALAWLLASLATAGNAQHHLNIEQLQVWPGSSAEKEHQEMIFQFLLRQADQATQRRLQRLQAIQSKTDFDAWQEKNRSKFLELIGGLPTQRTPLNAKVVGEFTREGYQVRKVIFESLPGFYVTANLYIPTTGQAPFPAVISPCGHSENGKAFDEYQRLYIGLVKRGYVVLGFDPLGQAERYQYWDLLTNRRRFGFNEHGMAGIQEYLLGQNLARYRIWDGIRGLDYLTSLPEVDHEKIACTGNSGGGTLTTYIAMLDERIKVVSIVTYITNLREKIGARILDAESDPEQDIQGQLAEGIDHTEMVGMIAPRPVMIGAAKRDFFPIVGTRKTFGELQQLYAKLGKEDRVHMVEFDHGHSYSQPLREATGAWFDQWLKGARTTLTEPSITPEKDSTLQCTGTGQVATSLGGRRIQEFNRDEADRLLADLVKRRESHAFDETLLAKLKERLKLPEQTSASGLQSLGSSEAGTFAIEKALLETEPGILVPERFIRLGTSKGRLPTIIYLRDRQGTEDSPSLFEAWASQGFLVIVADVRGFGETRSARNVPDRRIGYYDPRDGMDADFAYAALILGRPLLGMRVWDALKVVDQARSRTDADPARITLVGQNWSGLTALLAGALDTRISRVALSDVALSYGKTARAEVYAFPVSLMLPGALLDFDLPDILASLAPRQILVLNPLDPLNGKLDAQEAEQELGLVRKRYESMGAGQAFSLQVAPFRKDQLQSLEAWVSRDLVNRRLSRKPFTLSLSKGVKLNRSCFDQLSMNGLPVLVLIQTHLTKSQRAFR